MSEFEFQNNVKNMLLKYTIIPIIVLIVISIFSADPNLWVIKNIDHFYFEMIAVVLSFIVAFYFISQGNMLKEKFTIFLGLGFAASCIIDFLHASFAIIYGENPSFESYFIPQTWVAGSIFTGILMMIAIIKFQDTSEEAKFTRKMVATYSTIIGGISVAIIAASLVKPFPFVVIDFIIQRPYEVLSALFFSIAILYFYKNKLHEKSNVTYKGILLFLIISAFTSIIISYSTSVFDTSFSVAHILKDVGYMILILFIGLSIIDNYKSQKKLSEELEQRNKQQEEFSSMISHELKTPLTPIKGYCEMLEDQETFGPLTKSQEAYIKKIFSNADSLEHLITELLDTQKLDLQRMKFNKKSFEVSEFLIDIKEDADHLMKSKNIKFQIRDTVNANIYTDKSKLRQVFMNLIKNAVDFVPQNNGMIEISVKEKNDEMLFSVKDNGVGISKEIQEKIFKKFYQVDTSETRTHGGTGLGLSICKGIIEGLGGKLWVKSEQNKGSEFYFTVPKNAA